MRQFHFLDATDRAQLFHKEPVELHRDDSLDLLAHGLGATLYIPATRDELAADVLRMAARGATSCVLCLEDAIPDGAVEYAVNHLAEQLTTLYTPEGRTDLPLIFVRVRSADQPARLLGLMGESAAVIDGFVLPKFSSAGGQEYVDAVVDCERALGRRLTMMPVIETPEVMYHESRIDELLGIRDLLAAHAERVLAVRIGATDMASVFALRRPRDLTIYDVRLIASAVTDVVNVLGRPGGHAVTGPVWEYFTAPDRIFKPQLRESPFARKDDRDLRARLLAHNLDGLIREVLLDRANGLIGKTVIHPSHVPVVHALAVVTHEEHDDALGVLSAKEGGGGVTRSSYRNKMNEANPHLAWARQLMLRADVFGVAAPEATFVDLLAAATDEDRA
ncbi:HpcH/HpaI aldolase/citrate lyase family protein [Nocardioides sp. 1609]|uniref:HpcH/HpaI aldolase/citrate lyase family protein n=1 Tax=Nocardioides sp. 1609 TaxID=2508327 RepID=UPI00106FDF16|nr:HpcH/HpaI aldolase/citrate lyase family protein [Nocardioides sp. 1609]